MAIRDRDNSMLSSPARRHFIGVMTAALGYASTLVLSTRAKADPPRPPKEGPKDKGRCFLKGTRIRTSRGEIPVEQLSIGDHVVTARNQRLPIKWIGRQTFKKIASQDWSESLLPVRIARGALADDIPSRDLHVSAAHCLYIDNTLIPAGELVNGRSITRALPSATETIEYFHIELETHEVVYAEGVPAETLLVQNGREHFNNFVEYERLYGPDTRPAMTPFAPVLGYFGGRDDLMALLRLGASRFADVRDPIQIARDRIAARSAELVA